MGARHRTLGSTRPLLTAVLSLGLLTGCGVFGRGATDTDSAGDTDVAGSVELPDDASETLIRIGGAAAGDIVSLRAVDQSVVEWVNRRTGQVFSLDVSDALTAPDVVAEVRVDTRGSDWGLLDSVALPDGRRFATWTQPGSGDFEPGILVVGEIVDGVAERVLWSVGRVASTGIGGQLDVASDGHILLAIGAEAGWADEGSTRGAIVSLDPDGSQEQSPRSLSSGYIDPQAFLPISTDTAEELWVWDRAAPSASGSDGVERSGRADLFDRGGLTDNPESARTPTAMVELADGRIGVCGRGDSVMRLYDPVSTDAGERTGLAGGEALLPCTSGAAAFSDGTIVTVATLDGVETLQIRRP